MCAQSEFYGYQSSAPAQNFANYPKRRGDMVRKIVNRMADKQTTEKNTKYKTHRALTLFNGIKLLSRILKNNDIILLNKIRALYSFSISIFFLCRQLVRQIAIKQKSMCVVRMPLCHSCSRRKSLFEFVCINPELS